MHSDQEKLSTGQGERSFTLARHPEPGIPELLRGYESSPVPPAPRSLGDVMFGRKRKAIRRHNEDILANYEGGDFSDALNDMDARLAAANPDYRIASLAIALARNGKDTEIWLNLYESDWPTEQDVAMATAIKHNAEQEIREQYGR